MNLANCSICKKEVSITTPGQYTDMLECGHIIMKTSSVSALKLGAADAVEAESISKTLTKARELPKIDGNDLVMRILSTVNQTYEEFFNAENPLIDDMIKEHGKDNAVLIFTAIHAHISKILFVNNRFRNLYYIKIEQLRKEVEDKAVKELISTHDFHYENLKPSPKKIKTPGSKSGTDIDQARKGLGGLTTKDGKPLDVTKFMTNLMWKKDKEKEDYKAGLESIKKDIADKGNEA